ncbi:hypothetical protein NEOKW01_0278 [Nematocida sp. AWRm80]|nr:hypothetical protein NEOKW01_0278 [Nematocida sp. AWRm80]
MNLPRILLVGIGSIYGMVYNGDCICPDDSNIGVKLTSGSIMAADMLETTKLGMQLAASVGMMNGLPQCVCMQPALPVGGTIAAQVPMKMALKAAPVATTNGMASAFTAMPVTEALPVSAAGIGGYISSQPIHHYVQQTPAASQHSMYVPLSQQVYSAAAPVQMVMAQTPQIQAVAQPQIQAVQAITPQVQAVQAVAQPVQAVQAVAQPVQAVQAVAQPVQAVQAVAQPLDAQDIQNIQLRRANEAAKISTAAQAASLASANQVAKIANAAKAVSDLEATEAQHAKQIAEVAKLAILAEHQENKQALQNYHNIQSALTPQVAVVQPPPPAQMVVSPAPQPAPVQMVMAPQPAPVPVSQPAQMVMAQPAPVVKASVGGMGTMGSIGAMGPSSRLEDLSGSELIYPGTYGIVYNGRAGRECICPPIYHSLENALTRPGLGAKLMAGVTQSICSLDNNSLGISNVDTFPQDIALGGDIDLLCINALKAAQIKPNLQQLVSSGKYNQCLDQMGRSTEINPLEYSSLFCYC